MRPMSVDPMPIITNETTSVALRPIRSPKCPNTSPPTGRAMNPTAKVLKAASVPAVGLRLGKNCLLKINAAAVP